MKTACVILAAGEGKRMKSVIPKVLHPVCSEPMIVYPVSLALAQGWDPVVVVLSPRGEKIRQLLEQKFGDRIRFAVQDPPLGTGHAVLSARKALASFRGQVAILYGDVPLLAKQDLDALARAGRKCQLAFLSCHLDSPDGYGRVLRDHRGQVTGIVEHRDADREQRRITEVNAGIYLLESSFLFQALAKLGRTNSQAEYYLTDLIARARSQNLPMQAVTRKSGRSMLGVNDRVQLAQASAQMNLRLAEHWMRRGVTLIDPAHTYLCPDMKMGKDTVIDPGCFFSGRIRIGAACHLGPGVVMADSEIGPRAEIKAHSVLDNCRLGPDTSAGPFARLRPGAVLQTGASIGNFVEVKKSILGRGSKAGHLSYLGDAVIGAGVNVGAGTITCNYDGMNKHQTTIEDGVFIGSDTQLVAPVQVGKNAVIGAGTTVTLDVPAGALAVSRSRQQNIAGYARRRRQAKK